MLQRVSFGPFPVLLEELDISKTIRSDEPREPSNIFTDTVMNLAKSRETGASYTTASSCILIYLATREGGILTDILEGGQVPSSKLHNRFSR
jgi:hypothetical protein